MKQPTVLSLVVLLLLVGGISPSIAQEDTSIRFDYDYTTEAKLAETIDLDNPDPSIIQRVLSERRERVLQAIPDGVMLLFSVERAQPRRLEFLVPDSENHDFTFLTGLEGLDSLDSALLLLPAADGKITVLYTSAEPDRIREMTGIEDVYPFSKLEEHMSVALTDYRDWRITQIRRNPLAGAISKHWGRDNKVLFLNYPRFLRLGMPEPPRLALFEKMQRFSPELVVKDSADILDNVRMLHDAYGLACLRRAVQITREGLVEGLRAARPGMTEKQGMETIDFVYRYRGATLGFPTAFRKMSMSGRRQERSVPEGYIQFVPRSTAHVFESGDMIHTDTGAAYQHYSADVQRSMPVDGKFTPEQRRLYEITLDVQKAVISKIKPGVTWWELHNLAVEMLREAGGYDEYYTYGIGHFVGMEVHDEGDYEAPLQPGMVLAIEQGVAPPDGPRVALEDDVLVTETGHEWLSRTIPIEVDEIEAMAAVPSNLKAFVGKKPLTIEPDTE